MTKTHLIGILDLSKTPLFAALALCAIATGCVEQSTVRESDSRTGNALTVPNPAQRSRELADFIQSELELADQRAARSMIESFPDEQSEVVLNRDAWTAESLSVSTASSPDTDPILTRD